MFTPLKAIGIFVVLSVCSHQAVAEPLKTTRIGKPITSFVTHHEEKLLEQYRNHHSKGACLAKQENYRTHESLDPVKTATKFFDGDIKRSATILFHQYFRIFSLPNQHAAYAELKLIFESIKSRDIAHCLEDLLYKQFPNKFTTLSPNARANALALGHEILRHTVDNLLARNHNSFRDQLHFLETSFNTPELQAKKKLLHKNQAFDCLMYGLLPSYKMENYIQKSIEKFITTHTAAYINGQQEEAAIENFSSQMESLSLHDHFSEEKEQSKNNSRSK